MKNKYLLPALLLVVTVVSSCTTVKEYQKNRINDSEMALGNRKVEKTELNAQSYREGSPVPMAEKPAEAVVVTDTKLNALLHEKNMSHCCRNVPGHPERFLSAGAKGYDSLQVP